MSYTTKTFIEKSNIKHLYKYDYSLTNYTGSKNKVIIICPIHGDFEQTPNNHLNGQKCPKCANIDNVNIKYTLEEFMQKAKEIHGDKYDYSKIKYQGCKKKVCIICPEHGEFWQTPDNHINLRQGCPKCSISHGENFILSVLENKGIQFISLYAIKVPLDIRSSEKAFIDFYLPDYNCFIEYNGILHYQFVPYLHKGNAINFINLQKEIIILKNTVRLII